MNRILRVFSGSAKTTTTVVKPIARPPRPATDMLKRTPAACRLGVCIAWMCFATLGTATAIAQPSNDWLQSFQWREIGPSATGGRVVDIDVGPANVNHIFVASASGGLWETRNNGTTWQCIFDREGTLSIGDIAVDRRDPKTIWVGTGEANNQRSSLWGDGVYKTTDGGKTWINTGLQDTHHIGRIVIDPRDSQTVYVAALGHLYSSNDQRGLFKTTDGGATWEKVLYISPEVGVVDVVVHPKNPDLILAASYERLRRAWNFDGAGPGSAIYRSEDGGASWNRVASGLPDGEIGRIGLDYFAENPDVVFATVSNQNEVQRDEAGDGADDQRIGEAHGETVGEAGPEWSENIGSETPGYQPSSVSMLSNSSGLNADFANGSQDSESNTASTENVIETSMGIAIELFDIGAVVNRVDRGTAAQQAGLKAGDAIISIGGIETENVELIEKLLKSLKPGDSVTLVVRQDGKNRTVTLQVQEPRSRTRRPRQVGGEIYKSEDFGATWKKVNRRPVGGTPPYYYGQIRVDPRDANRIYVLSVPVYVSDDGGVNFRGDGATSVHVDHHALWINPNNSDHLMLGNDGGFHISYDRGKSWDYVFNLNLAQFYAVTADMQTPYHVYGGLQDNGSWGGPTRSTGRGVGREAWYRVGGGDGFYVQVDPDDPNIVISESQFGGIVRINRATGEFRSIRPPQTGETPNRFNWNSPIVMSKHDPRIIYFGGNKVFKSFNRGDDWLEISPDLTTADPEKISGNVPHCTITTISESRLDRNLLMVGTDDGKVHITRDGGKSWTDLSDRFPFRPPLWWCSRVELSGHDKDTAFVSFTGYREDDFRAFLFATTDGGETWKSIVNNLPDESINVVRQDPRNPDTLYVGTEFGVYVSLDQGQFWMPLDNGLPRVSVQDMLVHPRDPDLIVGTHGRGIFILDRITPLQEYDAASSDQPRLYSVPAWTRFRAGMSGMFAGDRKWIAADPPGGTSIWVQLPSDSDSVELTIVDSSGKEVAKLDAPDKAGLHRVDYPGRRQGRGGPRGPRGGGGGLSPGQYTVRLKVGDQVLEQPFEVR